MHPGAVAHDRPTEPLPPLDDTAVRLDVPRETLRETLRENSRGQGGRGQGDAGGPAGRGRRRVVVPLLVLAVVGALAGWGASFVVQHRATSSSAARQATGAVVVPVSVTSLDPTGGSGFQRGGGSGGTSGSGSDGAGATTLWRTQTYTSADFGRLKKGVGLVLDLGTQRGLSTVTFDAGRTPITVELRAGDRKPAATPQGIDTATLVGSPTSASGVTTLAAANAGSHRYWVVWVSKLGARDGGFGATISQPVARA